jgi:hypothetical protein
METRNGKLHERCAHVYGGIENSFDLDKVPGKWISQSPNCTSQSPTRERQFHSYQPENVVSVTKSPECPFPVTNAHVFQLQRNLTNLPRKCKFHIFSCGASNKTVKQMYCQVCRRMANNCSHTSRKRVSKRDVFFNVLPKS